MLGRSTYFLIQTVLHSQLYRVHQRQFNPNYADPGYWLSHTSPERNLAPPLASVLALSLYFKPAIVVDSLAVERHVLLELKGVSRASA